MRRLALDSLPRRVREIQHTWIPLPDGCRLGARIWLPADAEDDPVPAVLGPRDRLAHGAAIVFLREVLGTLA